MTETNDQKTAPQASAKSAGDAERIAKVLARAGLCSRREAEEWVLAGRVAVNGKVLESPAFTVGPKDRVTVDGEPLPVKERTRLWLFHKPRGLVTTNQDPEGRPTVFSVLPEDMPRVVTVGRLDINTEGLLLLTNDGGVARVLELPSTGWLRRYRVRAFGQVEEQALKDLAAGVSLDGVDYGPIEAEIERVQGGNVWLVLGLREGKNREVKRVLASLGLTVNRLIRVSFGPFQLADLDEGEIREIRGRVLRDQLGHRLVAESGADFDAPVVHHLQGDVEADEGKKRKIRAFTPAEEGDRDGRGPRRPARTKMEFMGTGEKRGRDRERERDGARDGGEKRFRSAGFRGRSDGGPAGPGKGRSEGFRDRPGGGDARPPRGRAGGFRDRPDASEKKGFRDRPRAEGDARPPRRPRFEKFDPAAGEGRRPEGHRGRPEGDRPRSEGYRGRSDFERPRSEGFRGRPDGDRPRSEGFRGRPDGDRPRSEGFRGRPDGDRPRSEGFRGRPEGDRPRSEGFRGRPDGDRPRSEGFRGRSDGDRPRSEGFRGRPDGDRPRSEGFRGRSDGDRPRSEGFKGRSEGGKTRAQGFRDRPEGGEAPKKPPRPEGFGPRGPRGMSPGGRKGGKGGPDGAPRGPKGGGKGRGGRS